MAEMKAKTMELNGVNVHMWKTDKFKTITCLLMAKAPLSEETVTERALLPHILQGGTKAYPNRKALRQKLDDMYGALLTADVQKKGEQHVLTFRVDVPAERFLKDRTPLFKEGLALLHNVVTSPKLEGEAFVRAIVDQEKRSHGQRIQSVYDDKMRYANVRITEEMFKEEAYRLPAYGKKEDLDTMNGGTLYRTYKDMLEHDRFDLYIIGSFEEEQAQAYIEELFTESRKPRHDEPAVAKSPSVNEVRFVQDVQEVKQGKLHMGFRTHTAFNDADYEALQVANGIFGGFPSSKLFMNVREKESLAYYAASRLESHKGIMMVMSGIEFEKYDRAVEIIKEQVKAVQTGDFTEEQLEQTKAMLTNQLLESVDTPRGFAELSYHEIVADRLHSIGDRIESIQAVTKDDVIRAANNWELDTIYFLTGEGEEA
ncbi:EF-P 5-aminopentanol modification-associated protein YfmF [Shouchella shacheensis]|uniref:EF-P 5-aminopentanol modification-associated protein YfmF n=1 Tax=Shouchella shacheensis TaxID=1649580 RepID=UPI0007402596|nr:pitrilysin family protein [Shouchella shacheensis]